MKDNVDKSSLIIKIVAIILIVAAVVGIICFMIFNKPQPHDNLDLSFAGKYILTSVSGLKDKNGKPVKAEDYEYNYIYLGEDGRYEIANKYGKSKTSQKGVWYTNEDTIYFESSRMFGFVKTTDHGKITSTTITMSMEAEAGHIEMVMTKEQESK